MSRQRIVQIWLDEQNVKDYPDLSNWTMKDLMEEFDLNLDDASQLRYVMYYRAGNGPYGLGCGKKSPTEEDRFCCMVTESLHQGLDGWEPGEQFMIMSYLADICHALDCEHGESPFAKEYQEAREYQRTFRSSGKVISHDDVG